ncbi:MAG: hypothetical protein RLZZ387_5155 [Chloroflexota bacterium]|jgi:hypothetical protein
MAGRKRLLINWVYYQPIGHAIEAYRYAQFWHNQHPELEIAVALNARSAVDLARCLPAVSAVYPVDLETNRTAPLSFWRTLIQELAAAFEGVEIVLLGALDPRRSMTHRVIVERRITYHECARRHYRAMLPRLGIAEGQPFMEGWPEVLAPDFLFARRDQL